MKKKCEHELETHLKVHSSIIYNSQTMEETPVYINRCMDKEDLIYVCMHAKLLSLVLLFVTPMDCSLPGVSVYGIF